MDIGNDQALNSLPAKEIKCRKPFWFAAFCLGNALQPRPDVQAQAHEIGPAASRRSAFCYR